MPFTDENYETIELINPEIMEMETKKYYDDGGENHYLVGHEFGSIMVIRADSLESAWEIFIDESPTIERDELPNAFGFYIMRSNPETNAYYICSDHDDHGELTSEKILVCNGDRRTIGKPFQTESAAIDFCMEYVTEHEIDLAEGYEYQSNSTDTGIVNIGHHTTIKQIGCKGIIYYDNC